MAILALNSAATGLRALSTKIDVAANNLANSETTAFKRSRVNFEDLFYLKLKQPGIANAQDSLSPAGIFVGLGTRVSNTQIDTEQGPIETTNNPWDVAIEGEGFFAVEIADSVGDGVGYTRSGNFFRNNEGELVLGMGDGYRIVPNIQIPEGADDFSVSSNGEVSVRLPGALEPQVVGQIQITRFINPQGLEQLGGSIFLETASSGPAQNVVPGEDGAGRLLGGHLEGSNVDPVRELVGLIKTQRAFELNSQSIQTANQALQTVANLRRG